MIGLFSTFRAAANSMRTLDQAMAVVQNNVTNANTPGYVRQDQSLISQRFQPEYGDAGGVSSGSPQSARNELTEQTVRRQQSEASYASQQSDQLSQLETLFPVQGGSSITGRLSSFFQTVSQWALQPNDATARQTVLDSAANVARGFQQTAVGLQQTSAQTDQALSTTADQINRLASNIRNYNISRRTANGREIDAGADAQLHRTLEELSQFSNLNVLKQDDGSVTVLLGGQHPLVVGENVHPIQIATTNASAAVLSDTGADLTGILTGGKLGAQLGMRNQTLPKYQSALDGLAKSFADQVNTITAAGLDQNGNTPAQPMFQYTAGSVASSLAFNSSFTATDLAAAATGAPGGNANAIALSRLDSAATTNGKTLHGAYADLVRQVGEQLSSARDDNTSQTSLLQQAQQWRERESGVSLDEEAAKLIQLQRGYQATAKLITIVDELTQTVMGMIR